MYWSNRAAAHLMAGSFERCIGDCQVVLEREPGNAKALLRMAKAFLRRGQTVRCRSAADRVLALEPQNPQARGILADLQRVDQLARQSREKLDAGDTRLALQYAEQGLAEDMAPLSVPLLMVKAESLLRLRQYSMASRIATGVLRDHRMNADALAVRGMCQYYTGDSEGALKLINMALNSDPDHRLAKSARSTVTLPPAAIFMGIPLG